MIYGDERAGAVRLRGEVGDPGIITGVGTEIDPLA